ncbi:MAG: NADH-quinone oxidoreductase subunit J [Rickettsiales bacterium]|nr:NADH-quinone oxidoreductase subunit J [Pseudomonadota bacterium]MDA0966681.1 NADH-quinone oxidoreductase subunit J [Pseudomonadota bacterium]MDG4543709.1 NADH-quinone oxidoreductase subunit J [Rickettsiales bacterium]MDG4545856.1 NADH-quinone oxidoreductase subunit J [Rickettsiales bacterium]MDG4547370.1 NADH-quinone oxidoreductase subunit J [Rickettsiales bacterium]
MLIANLLFYILSFVLIFSAIVVITVKNPVHSVLFLILAFFNSAGLFLMLGAEFISMLIIIVYVGAVAVLFLFVVMMLDIDFEAMSRGFVRHLPILLLVSAVMLAELIMVIQVSSEFASVKSVVSSKIPSDITNTEAIGRILYTDYIYPFQLSGIILLVAMIGAIVLTHRTRPGVKKQNISKQVSRSRKDGVELVKVQSKKGV